MNLNRIKYTFGKEILFIEEIKSNEIDTLLFIKSTTIPLYEIKNSKIIFNSNYDFKINGIKINPKNISIFIRGFNIMGDAPISFILSIKTEAIHDVLISKRNKKKIKKMINNKKEI